MRKIKSANEASVCQATAGVGCFSSLGSDLSEVLAVGVGSAALDCGAAPMCPPGLPAVRCWSATNRA